MFCGDCIGPWLNRSNACPMDMRTVSMAELRPAPRIYKNQLSRLEIR